MASSDGWLCRGRSLFWNRSRADGCSGTWPAVPATAPPLHGAPGEEPARDRVQVVDALARRCQEWREMVERKLSATDAALRERITELSVHIPCSDLRGPVHGRWQSCRDEDSPEKWEGCDVSREYDLCIVCFRATAGGTSRWALLDVGEAAVEGFRLARPSRAGGRPG